MAKDNLSLLSVEGVMKRKQQISEMIERYGRQSHKEAIKSTELFLNIIQNRKHRPLISCFIADCFDKNEFKKINVKADVIITDVPYGNLVSWSERMGDPINRLLNNVKSVLHSNSVIVISSNKKQKIKNDGFQRVDKFIVGRRAITILKGKVV